MRFSDCEIGMRVHITFHMEPYTVNEGNIGVIRAIGVELPVVVVEYERDNYPGPRTSFYFEKPDGTIPDLEPA